MIPMVNFRDETNNSESSVCASIIHFLCQDVKLSGILTMLGYYTSNFKPSPLIRFTAVIMTLFLDTCVQTFQNIKTHSGKSHYCHYCYSNYFY